jgi:DNA-binding transcriptional ArsR family regulator
MNLPCLSNVVYYEDSEAITRVGKALACIGQPTTLRLTALVLYSPSTYITVPLATAVLGMSRSTIDRHVKKMQSAGLLRRHSFPRKQNWAAPLNFYSLFPPLAGLLGLFMDEVFKQSPMLQADNHELMAFLDEHNGQIYPSRPRRTKFGPPD